MKRVSRSLLMLLTLCSPHTIHTITSIKTVEHFEDLREKGTPMVVKFFAPWCEACNMVASQYRKVSKDHLFSHITFATVNADQAGQLTDEKKVKSVPTFLFIADGKVKARVVGIKDPNTFETFLKQKIRAKLPARSPSRYRGAWGATTKYLKITADWLWAISFGFLGKIKGLFGF